MCPVDENVLINVDVNHRGTSVLLRTSGELDEDAGQALEQALDKVTAQERDLMVDLHAVAFMDFAGLLHLLKLHRRAEGLGLKVAVTGWHPQQAMAEVAGIPGPGSATGERYALAGFRRLIEERARSARDQADFASGWLPRS